MTDPDIEAACEDITKGLKTHRGSSPSAKLVRALESRSDEGLPYLLAASEVVIVLEAMRGAAQGARVPKVRTSHHRNKEEAARLQELVAQRYATLPRKELLGMLDYLENAARVKATGFVAPEVEIHNMHVENFAAGIREALALPSTDREGGK